MKICRKCKIDKNENNFSPSAFNNKYGICRECIAIYGRQWRKNPEIKLLLKIRSKKWRQANLLKIKVAYKKWTKNNLEKVTKAKLKWAKENPIKVKESNNKSRRKRYHNDIAFRIGESASRMVNTVLKKNSSHKKRNSFFSKVGWTTKELWEWLEMQFSHQNNLDENKKIWMNRDNYGSYTKNGPKTWQLDHIIPQSDLPYSSMEDENFKKCWALENLRPLESKKNLMEGVKRIRHKGGNK